jgi:predicted permease
MNCYAYVRSLAARFLHRSQVDRELAEELRSHILHRADDLERSGLCRAEAERRARIEFGGQVRFKEECQEALGGNFLETLAQDFRFSFRVLRKSPGFAFTGVITLALSIGANAIVFGVLNGLIIRPLNVPQAESLWGLERGSGKAVNHSFPDYRDLCDRNRSFDGLAAYNVASVGVDTGNNPSSAWIMETSGNYFDVLRIQPYLGRFFHSADEHGPGSAPFIVLGYGYWQMHFQADRGVIGRIVRLNKFPFTVIGVTPPEFRGTLLFVGPDFWVPIVNQQQVEGSYVLDTRGKRELLMVMGHLKAGVTPAQAISDLNSVGAYLEKSYPKDEPQMTFSLARPTLSGDWLGGPIFAFLTGLMLLSALILLAACANLGSLFAARAADRSREIALRLALGSSRSRLLRHLFTEAVLISLAGGAAGLWASIGLLHGLSAWRPLPGVSVLHVPVDPDAKVYAIALALALVSALLFGIVPVRQVLRTDPYQIVKSGSTGTIRRRITIREVLLAVQIAICAVLVTSSMVAVRGLVRSLHSNFGFEPRNAVLLEAALNTAGYNLDAVPAIEKRLMDRLETIPGVQAVGSVDRLPLFYGANTAQVFTGESADLRPSNAVAEAAMYRISPDYFHAAGTALLSGRAFTWHEDTNSSRVAVINRRFAAKIFGSEAAALGAHFKLHDGTRLQVVGIVADGKYENLAEDPLPAMFLPIMQWPSTQTAMIVRSARDPQQLIAAIKQAVREVDAGLPFEIKTWDRELDSALFGSRMATISLGVLGAMGALLSITGIFGMAAYSVSKRLRELGIRMALGAQRSEVLRAALGRALRLLAFGSSAGLLLGVLASRVLASIVYQATPRDPLVLAGVVLAMLLLGLIATWLPARRALSLDPLLLLREE